MECNGCGMCCYIPPIQKLNKEPSVWCEHYIQGKGCNDYDNRPEECRNYRCLYLDSQNLPDDIKPDNCGVIIEKYDDIFILVTEPYNFDSWKNVTDFIGQVCKKGYSIVITSYTDKRRLVITEQGKSKEIMERVQKMAKEEYGCTELHN